MREPKLASHCETELHTFCGIIFHASSIEGSQLAAEYIAEEDQMDALLTTDGGVAALIVGALLGMVVLFIGGSWVRVLDGSSENPK